MCTKLGGMCNVCLLDCSQLSQSFISIVRVPWCCAQLLQFRFAHLEHSQGSCTFVLNQSPHPQSLNNTFAQVASHSLKLHQDMPITTKRNFSPVFCTFIVSCTHLCVHFTPYHQTTFDGHNDGQFFSQLSKFTLMDQTQKKITQAFKCWNNLEHNFSQPGVQSQTISAKVKRWHVHYMSV